MLRDFADWLRVARPELTSEIVTLRWSATESFGKAIDTNTALEIVRLSYKMAVRDKSVRNRLEATLQAADAAFPMRDNEHEIQIIAASVVMYVLQQENDTADTLALAVITTGASDRRDPPVVPDLIPCAERYLLRRGKSIRKDISVTRPNSVGAVTKAATEYAKADAATRDAAPTFKAIAAALQAHSESITALVASHNQSSATLLERSEMLWYTIGSHDLHAGTALKSYADSAPLIVGADVASITRFNIPPIAARAIISRVLSEAFTRKAKQATVETAIAALNEETRSRLIVDLPLTLAMGLCPIHETVARSTDGIDLSGVLAFRDYGAWPADELAYQTYTECLLLRSLQRRMP